MKHETWLNVAKTVADDSKCVSMKVGCVLVRNDELISTGINGTPRKYVNCCDKFDGRSVEHSAWSEKYEIHSELNAVIQCSTSTRGATAYITHSPCFNCLKHLIGAGVKEIHFIEMYYRMSQEDLTEILDFCTYMNVTLIHYPHMVGE